MKKIIILAFLCGVCGGQCVITSPKILTGNLVTWHSPGNSHLCLRPLANGEKRGSAFTAVEFMKRHRGTVLRLAGTWARTTGEGAAKDCLGNVYEVLLSIEKRRNDIDMNRIGVARYAYRYVLNVMRNELRANIRRQHREQLSRNLFKILWHFA